MTAFPLSPWHMWGTTFTSQGGLNLLSSGNPIAPLTTQLARVNYKRPETWKFFFGARLVSVPTPLSTMQIFVDFDLMLGIGRGVFQPIRPDLTTAGSDRGKLGFVRFSWAFDIATDPLPQDDAKWTTTTRAPVLDEFDVLVGGTPYRPDINSFVAEDIQCTARVNAITLGVTNTVPLCVELAAFFAPYSHVRPDWFSADEDDEDRYRGHERGGT